MTEKDLMTVAAASTAHALLVNLQPIMRSQEESIISNMKNDYRAGNLDPQKLISHIAQLCVIEDMAETLKARINKGKGFREAQ